MLVILLCRTYQDRAFEDEEEDFFANPVDTTPIVVPADYVPASKNIPEGSELEQEYTLFVGNLAAQTTLQTLQNFFKQFGRFKVWD